jgi:SAM-dependent methyltransferase
MLATAPADQATAATPSRTRDAAALWETCRHTPGKQKDTMGTDKDWIEWGKQDPYYAVFTHERFRGENLDEAGRQALFDAGRLQVATHLAAIRRHFDEGFRPRRVLDFGCGVGRVAIPLAELDSVSEVVGVDISPAMLEELGRNCPPALSRKLSLARSDDRLSAVEGCFDLVHSSIVLQHIPVRRGLALFAELVARVAPGGAGVLQVVYAKSSANWRRGREPRIQAWLIQLGARLVAGVRRLGASLGLVRRVDPVMEMNCYPLNELTWLLQQQGIDRYLAELSDHGGALSITLLFQRSSD